MYGMQNIEIINIYTNCFRIKKTIPMANKDRKTFYYEDNKDLAITAGGVIVYRSVKGKTDLLLVESRGVYEDLGGRTDDDDDTIFTTISREAEEESNELLNKRSIKKRLKKAESVHIPKSKYVVYIIKATEDESILKSADFGDKEIHDNISRKIKWISLSKFLSPDVIKYKLNFRLKSKTLFTKLKDIDVSEKMKINMMLVSSDEKKPTKKK